MRQTWIFISTVGLMSAACAVDEQVATQELPLQQLPGLQSITFYERTGGTAPTAYTFAVNSSQLTSRLSSPLTYWNKDYHGVSWGEYYDVFYSDADGVFDIDGDHITVEAVWNRTLPAGGGLNLAEVRLNFSDGSTDFADSVTSYVALGDNSHPETVTHAVDGDLQTHTTMGNTVGTTARLRVTVGFDALEPDSDGDGIPDSDDRCPETAATDLEAGVPSERLGTNRWADVDGDGVFDTTPPQGHGPGVTFTMEDTAGCNCAQIIENLGLGRGHQKYGCSIGVMREWLNQVDE